MVSPGACFLREMTETRIFSPVTRCQVPVPRRDSETAMVSRMEWLDAVSGSRHTVPRMARFEMTGCLSRNCRSEPGAAGRLAASNRVQPATPAVAKSRRPRPAASRRLFFRPANKASQIHPAHAANRTIQAAWGMAPEPGLAAPVTIPATMPVVQTINPFSSFMCCLLIGCRPGEAGGAAPCRTACHHRPFRRSRSRKPLAGLPTGSRSGKPEGKSMANLKRELQLERREWQSGYITKGYL